MGCCIAPLMYILMNGLQGTIIWEKLVETEMGITTCAFVSASIRTVKFRAT